MAMFDAISAAGSGMVLNRKWMDAVGDNISNMNTAAPTSGDAFRQRYVVAQTNDYGINHAQGAAGVTIAGVAFGSGTGRTVYEPDNPLADTDGYVKYPDIDLSSQMGQLIVSQRAYQANAAVVTRAQASYQAALQIGQK
jgi:flagellar basal-body rod protein FlgC